VTGVSKASSHFLIFFGASYSAQRTDHRLVSTIPAVSMAVTLRVETLSCLKTVSRHFLIFGPLSSSRHDLNYDDCLEDNRENYQNCSVLCCVQQLYTDMHTNEQCWFRFIFCTFVYV